MEATAPVRIIYIIIIIEDLKKAVLLINELVQ